jgi:hypothetical protein
LQRTKAFFALRAILPALHASPSLTKINLNSDLDFIGREETEALAQALQLRVDISLFNMRPSSDEAHLALCNGIAESRATGLSFNFNDIDVSIFVNALASTQVPKITIDSWPRDLLWELPDFLSTLAGKLPAMKVKSLDLGELLSHIHEFSDDRDAVRAVERVMPLVVRGVSMNSMIKVLTLPSVRYLHAMDKALALLARARISKLEQLLLWAPKQPLILDLEPNNLPLFLDALRDNFTLHEVNLCADHWNNFLDIPEYVDKRDMRSYTFDKR